MKLYFVFFKNIQSNTLDILLFSGAKVQHIFDMCNKKSKKMQNNLGSV